MSATHSVEHLRRTIAKGPLRTTDVHPHQDRNQAIGVAITTRVGSMWCAYAFAALALVSLPAAILSRNVIVIVSWLAQTLLQLVLLPIVIVGQNVQAAHTDARAEMDHEILQHETEILSSLHEMQVQQTDILFRLDPREMDV